MVPEPRAESVYPRQNGRGLTEAPEAATGSELSRHSPDQSTIRGEPSASAAIRAAYADPTGFGPFGAYLYRVCDATAALSALVAAFVVSNLGPKPKGFAGFLAMRLSVKNLLLLVGFAMAWRAICTLCGLYEWRRIASPRAECVRVLLACALGSLAAVAFPLTSVSGAFTYPTLLIFGIGTCIGILTLRGTVRLAVAARPKPAKSILIVGSGPLADEVMTRLR